MAPSDENECRQMLSTGFALDTPSAIRYPRGTGPGATIDETLDTLPLGRGEIRRQGSHIAILSFGSLLDQALIAAEALDATVANMRFVKPLDEALVLKLAAEHDLLITLEDNAVKGGAGSAVNELLAAMQQAPPCLNLGLPDHFVEHGRREELLADCGLDASGILRAARRAQDTYRPAALPLELNSK